MKKWTFDMEKRLRHLIESGTLKKEVSTLCAAALDEIVRREAQVDWLLQERREICSMLTSKASK